jgi:Ca2+-binding RTX toxin-like protein
MRSSLIGPIVVLLLLAATPATAWGTPSCSEGPQIVGETIEGTPCDDTIRAPRSVTTVFGEGGNDTIFGGRGNDRLYGGPGNDRLYGGIGDDRPRGGPGDDLLSGGFGADSLDGEAGDDFVRGDATIDAIFDTGGGTDTLSYATGVTPGFPNQGSLFDYEGFPGEAEGRGVYIDLFDEEASSTGFANDGLAPAGGGVDLELEGTSFERIIGTPFPDFIVGSSNAEQIYGGGGADVIIGEGGADQIHGGAEGDSCEGGPTATGDCETGAKEVEPRDPSSIAVGQMAPGVGPPAVYLTGSDAGDRVAATYSDAPPKVSFELLAGSSGSFDTDPNAAEGCEPPSEGRVVCPLPAPPDTVLLAGLGGDDTLTADGFPASTSVVGLGGAGADDISAGATEDALVDGPGNDLVDAGGGDDAVPNNEGADVLHAGGGEDLFISDSVCEGDLLDGGADRDNANWANFDSPVALDLGSQSAGLIGAGGAPSCGSGTLTSLQGLEDIEGTNLGDDLTGDAGPNQLLGRLGPDSYRAAAGDDSILANSGDADPLIDCGPGFDTAQVDHPEFGDAVPVECEAIHERDPNSFRPPDTPPAPESPPPPPPEPRLNPPIDRKPPRTGLSRHPRKLLKTRRARRHVVFAFKSEPGARFRCRIDRRRYTPCTSPRAYQLAAGRHVFAVFAIDAAGNRDPSPALYPFRVLRISDRSSRIHRRRVRTR